MKRSDKSKQKAKGVIQTDVTYTLKEFMAITGKGRHAIAECKKRGLRILKDGRTPLINGQDYTDYLFKINGRQKNSPGTN